MTMSIGELAAHALRDSSVRKRRPLRSPGFYVPADDLLRSVNFWAAGEPIEAKAIDDYVEKVGGQRLGGVRRPSARQSARAFRLEHGRLPGEVRRSSYGRLRTALPKAAT